MERASSRLSVSLTAFLGRDLITALGGLEPGRLLGPWPGGRPRERRPRATFAPVLYGEDHAHEHAELCLLLEGKCRFSFDRESAVLRAGDLVACPARAPHGEAYLKPGYGYRLAWWSLAETDPRLHVTRYSRRGYAIEHAMNLALLPADARERLRSLRAMTAAARAPDCEAAREALLTIALTLYRKVLDGGGAQLDTRAQLVRRAIAFIRENARRPLALAEVARAARVSPNYLTGLFREETGAPLGRFILEERIALAKRLLDASGASVKAVAHDLGFSDPFAFSRAFKRVAGKSPRAWTARDTRQDRAIAPE